MTRAIKALRARESLDSRGWPTIKVEVQLEDGIRNSASVPSSASTSQKAARGERIEIVGDDLYVTNTRFIARGVAEKATNAVLIKPNQIGIACATPWLE